MFTSHTQGFIALKYSSSLIKKSINMQNILIFHVESSSSLPSPRFSDFRKILRVLVLHFMRIIIIALFHNMT